MKQTEIHDLLVKAVREEIERSVNGGIRGIDKKLSEHISADTVWKNDAKPAIDNMKNLSAGWKIILSVFGSIAVVASGVIGIKKLLNL